MSPGKEQSLFSDVHAEVGGIIVAKVDAGFIARLVEENGQAVVRISLNPGGGNLGFESEIAGSDARLSALLEVIRLADTRGGHKCPNAGAIRFQMRDGSEIGVGLLPGHTKGLYEFRLYDGDKLIAAYSVKRLTLLGALADLGVPMDDPAFRE